MVEGRYNEPVEPSPDVELIGHYCWLAEPKNGAPENERDAAVASLIDLYREQRAQVQSGNLPTIDPRLLLFIRAELGRCILSPDPLNAIELLLERRRRPRGRPKTPHRNFVIAGDVAEKVEGGMTIEITCADVAEATCLSEEEVRRIYITIRPQTLAVALQRGATLYVGPRHAEDMTHRDEIERILMGHCRFAHANQIDSLIVPFAYCWHFLKCVGRSQQYNHKYPVSRLRGIVAECFGLGFDDVPAAAVLTALGARLCFVKRVRHGEPEDWIATITSTACPGDTRRESVPLCDLGRRGALPPIEIRYL
jgi:hypothetical protein